MLYNGIIANHQTQERCLMERILTLQRQICKFFFETGHILAVNFSPVFVSKSYNTQSIPAIFRLRQSKKSFAKSAHGLNQSFPNIATFFSKNRCSVSLNSHFFKSFFQQYYLDRSLANSIPLRHAEKTHRFHCFLDGRLFITLPLIFRINHKTSDTMVVISYCWYIFIFFVHK